MDRTVINPNIHLPDSSKLNAQLSQILNTAQWELIDKAVISDLIHAGADVNTLNQFGETALELASKYGDIDCVKELLASPNIFSCPGYGDTALRLAAQSGFREIVNLLLATPAINVNKINARGHTALSIAAKNGHSATVTILLDAPSIILDNTHTQGGGALLLATENQHTATVAALVSSGRINVNQIIDDQTALLLAARLGDHATLRVLLSAPNIIVNQSIARNRTALTTAATHGHLNSIIALLAAPGILVNKMDDLGDIALIEAADRGHLAIVKALLAAPGIEVNLENLEKSTAISKALEYDHVEIASLLQAHGASLPPSYTPLMMAAFYGHAEIAAALLSNRYTEVNLTNPFGKTALMIATSLGRTAVVQTMMNAQRLDIDLNRRDHNNESALTLAIKYAHIDVLKVFVPHLNQVIFNTETYSKNRTAFMMAVRTGNTDVVKILSSHLDLDGINFENTVGETALKIAIENTDLNMVNALVPLMDVYLLSLVTQKGDTALIAAIERGFTPAIHTLIAVLDVQGVNMQDSYGKTALIKASMRGYFDIVESLIMKGADIHTKSYTEDTALSCAADLNYTSIAYRLLSAMSSAELTILQTSPIERVAQLATLFKIEMLTIQMDIYHTLRTFHHTRPFASLEGSVSLVFDFDKGSKPKWYHHRMEKDVSAAIEKLNKQQIEKAETAKEKAERDRQAHILADPTVIPCVVSKKIRKPVVFSCLKKRVNRSTTEQAAEPPESAKRETPRRNAKRAHSFMGIYTK